MRTSTPPLSSHAAIVVAGLCMLVLATGCASTKVTQQTGGTSERLPKPGQIWVYDFVASAADVPADSLLADEFNVEASDQTSEQAALGRELGASIASELVTEIREMEMPATRAGAGTMPTVDDLVIRGYLVSIDPGSAAKRVAVGLGSGASDLRTVVEGFQVTPTGTLRKLGSGTVDSSGGKAPGGLLGVAAFAATANPAGLIVSSGLKAYGEASGSAKVEGRAKATAQEIAAVLKQRFEAQGWIE